MNTSKRNFLQYVRLLFLKFGVNIHTKYSFSEKKLISTFLNEMKIDSVIDIGANSGQFALEIRAAGWSGELLSLEPQVAHYEFLKKIMKNDLKFKALNIGVGGEEISFKTQNISDNFGLSSSFLRPSLDFFSESGISFEAADKSIEVVPISNVLSFVSGKNVLIKSDTQGYERFIFDTQSFQEVRNNCAGIYIESSFERLYEDSWEISECLNFFYNHDFVLWGVFPKVFDKKTNRILEADLLFGNKLTFE